LLAQGKVDETWEFFLAALDREIADAEQATAATGHRRRKSRQAEPGWCTTGVERQVHVIEVPPEEQTCPTCHDPGSR
jgi:hypothetical protein